ncbi:uncharacterized protein LOC114172401 [Vigna unguiculata]|uniref:uncharacterized protein LOC114172401 n=1 Tax=Vigna unguiculata TaxID=3917 RepID=UPI001016AD8B|nr:uncharacterized protein LOC114172401 [Vigna unguiculata]
MSIIIIRRGIPEVFRGTVSEDVTTAKEFLVEIEKCFAKAIRRRQYSSSELDLHEYQGKGNIREYIMSMSNIVFKLKALKLEISENLLIHLVLISLPAQFNQFKVYYNCQKDKWSLMSSFHIVCKKRKDRSKTRQK